jgi:SpoIID/LytB domain protein
MKQIRVGLTGPDLQSLKHASVQLYSRGAIAVLKAAGRSAEPLSIGDQKPLVTIKPGEHINIWAQADSLKIDPLPNALAEPVTAVILQEASGDNPLFVGFSKSQGQKAVSYRYYQPTIIVEAVANEVRVFVQCDLDDYTAAVVHSEIPGTYALEAIKAQAVAARTYALRPRVDHKSDHCQVCDSYLCCQAYGGPVAASNSRTHQAVSLTKGQVMVFADEPILALFSSSAGGHTENYESCFSDLVTNAFPPAPIPYLKGVSEGPLPSGYLPTPDDKALAALWQSHDPKTLDSWAPQFKWSVRLPIDTLEAHMHHVVDGMLADKDTAPFVIPPQSQIFGSIEGFTVEKRGVGGTAVVLSVKTSKGIWQFQKELVIRSLFKNTEANISRLKSARVYFGHERQVNNRLSCLVIHGLGYGHGVGMQQTGADGWARLAQKSYRQILQHYFTGIQISQI